MLRRTRALLGGVAEYEPAATLSAGVHDGVLDRGRELPEHLSSAPTARSTSTATETRMHPSVLGSSDRLFGGDRNSLRVSPIVPIEDRQRSSGDRLDLARGTFASMMHLRLACYLRLQ